MTILEKSKKLDVIRLQIDEKLDYIADLVKEQFNVELLLCYHYPYGNVSAWRYNDIDNSMHFELKNWKYEIKTNGNHDENIIRFIMDKLNTL